MNYRVVAPYKLYPIANGISIVSGTPFLFLDKPKTLVCGDLHLGQESSLFYTSGSDISQDIVSFVDLLEIVLTYVSAEQLIINGDIKHNTSQISSQEVKEMEYLVDKMDAVELKIGITLGNHDKLLKPLLGHLDLDHVILSEYFALGTILIFHGHTNPPDITFDACIISHEHPAFTFHGYNRARMKLPAFVTITALDSDVIILPSANSISLGVNFPPSSSENFLSPFLKENAILKTMTIYPFDLETGLFELPPLANWGG